MQELAKTPATHQRCTNWINNKQDQELAPLLETSQNKSETEILIEIRYKYCQEYKGEIVNVQLLDTAITYDPIENTLYSGITNMEHCKFNSGFCTTQSFYCEDILQNVLSTNLSSLSN